MGSGASTSVSSLLTHADSTEVESVFASLPPACREKLAAALASHEALQERAEEVSGFFNKEGALEFATHFPGKPYVDTVGTRFSEILRKESMAVVKSSYFEKQFSEQKPYQDRASIDPAFFFCGEEVLKKWQKYGAKFLMIVSYSWLSREHPDPELFHLKRLCKMLELWRSIQKNEDVFSNSGPEEFGVIIDFCCLWQGETRTEVQLAQFKEGLAEINTPYGHQEVLAIKLTAVPLGELRGYLDRGWTLFESCVIDGKGSSAALGEKNPGAGSLNVLSLGDNFDFDGQDIEEVLTQLMTGHRQPCKTPSAFEKAMTARGAAAKQKGVNLFTSGKDQPFVIDKYRKAFNELVTTTESMVCCELGWGEDEMVELGEMLAFCKVVKVLDLGSNSIGDAGAEKIAAALPSLPSLQQLELSSNSIGDAGAEKIAAALPSLPLLQMLDLRFNNIGAAGAEKIAAALPSLPLLQQLELGGNHIGDAGAEKIAAALPSLPSLQMLSLGDIGAAGAEKIAAALPSLPSLQMLNLGGHSIGDAGAEKIAAALPSLPLLQELRLFSNSIGDAGAEKIAAALPSLPLLQELDLDGGHSIGDTGRAKLRSAALPSLTLLHV